MSRRYQSQENNTISTSTANSTGYFNNLFKLNHLYYRFSAKEPTGSVDSNAKDEDGDDDDDDDGDSSGFMYPNEPPKSSGSVIENRNNTKSNQRTKRSLSWSDGGKCSLENQNPCGNGQLRSNPSDSAIPRSSFIPFIPSAPKFYENGESALIKRGSFKGKFDDRHIRCLYYENRRQFGSISLHCGCKKNYSKQCYCSFIPIVPSPLKSVTNYSDLESLIGNGKSSFNSKMGNRFDMINPSNKPRDTPNRIISRVKQRFNADYDLKGYDSSANKLKNSSYGTNSRRFGHAPSKQTLKEHERPIQLTVMGSAKSK